ncbi:MAG: aspartyl protease family protein [Alphaproteobacteria bacterium]|nr:aspartyl protease family protein [Alphaproteobacteria bacterium]
MRKTVYAAMLALCLWAPASAKPSFDEVLSANKAATGGSAWDGKITLSLDGDYSGQGLTGTVHTMTDLKDGRSANAFQVGPATGGNGFDGSKAWQKDTSGTVTLQEGGDAQVLAVNQAYRDANKWWLPDHGGAAITSGGEKTTSSGRFDVITVAPRGGKAFEAWFDFRTHFLVRIVEQQGALTVTTTLADYRAVDGVMLPFKFITDKALGAKYVETVTITKAAFLGAQPDSAYAPPKVVVADFAIAGGRSETTVPIQLINNHIYGAASVNGKGPFVFIFDTGGHNLVAPPLAKELGLKVEGNLAGTGAGEAVMEAGFTHVSSLSVGDATVTNQLFIVAPLDQLSDIEGMPLPGMVGYEMFRRFVTRIDYGAHTLTLIDPKKFDAKDAGTPVKFVFNDSIPEVMGTFEGIPAKFDIDTGSRSEATVTKPFAEKNKLRNRHPKGVEAVDGWGTGGRSTGYITRVAAITLGSVRVENIVASLTTQNKGAFAGSDYSANIGGGVLKRFVVTFDYDNQVMYLKPRPGPVADIGTFDRAGMWINQSDAAFEIVDVTKGGPADDAGLKAGDKIAAVDGTPVASIHLYDLRQRLRNERAGTVVNLRILHKGKYRRVAITLRDLI